MTRILSFAFGLTALGLSACATAPKQACTAAWIEYEVNDIYKELRRDTKREISNFKSIAAALEDSDKASPLIAFQLIGLSKDVERVVEAYVETYKPRLESLADTCDQPDLVADALQDFLRQEGAPETVIGLLKDFSVLLESEQVG